MLGILIPIYSRYKSRNSAGLLRQSSSPLAVSTQPKILIVVEGQNDIEFLRRISAILHYADASMPDLADLERRLELVFVPSGGGDSPSAFRFAALNLPEFHLLDRDLPPATEARQRAAAMVNSRPRCHAVITSKLCLENYLHSDAIFEASGISIEISDEVNVPDTIARHEHDCRDHNIPWNQLPVRTRKRMRNKAKKWLNREAVDRMTSERLADRDPDGEVRSWLTTIATLIANNSH